MLKEKFLEFILYLWFFLKKFAVWMVAAGGALGLLFLLQIIKAGLPGTLLWLVGCAGLIWTSFRVYKEQQKVVPPEKDIIKVKRRAKIVISLREDNRFDYLIDDTGIAIIKRELPHGRVVLHTELTNRGPSDVDVLSLKGYFRSHELWFVNFQTAALDEKNKEIVFPKHLPAGSKLDIDLMFPVQPNPTLNQAQIKDRLLAHIKNCPKLDYGLKLEYKDCGETTRSLLYSSKVSPERLVGLYLQKQRELDDMVAGFNKGPETPKGQNSKAQVGDSEK